jgi:hypothetical protein
MTDMTDETKGDGITLLHREFANSLEEESKRPSLPADWSKVLIAAYTSIRVLANALDAVVVHKRCEYCDDTGDVHGIDGEWRGVCTACDAHLAAQSAMRVRVMTLEEAVACVETRLSRMDRYYHEKVAWQVIKDHLAAIGGRGEHDRCALR